MNTEALLNPYVRITMANLDIEVRLNGSTYDIRLVNGRQIIAHQKAPRTRTISLAQAIEKARNGRWGPTSGFFKAMESLADLAELISARNNKND